MGVLSTLRGATKLSAIRQAVRSSSSTAGLEPSARIGNAGPHVGWEMPALPGNSNLVRYEALNPDPQRWFQIMQRADNGDTSAMIDLFLDALTRDSHLDGVTRKRVQSMMGRPIALKPPEGLEKDKEALDIAQKVRRILLNDIRFIDKAGTRLGFRSALQHFMSASAFGYAVAPMKWRKNARGYHVPDLAWEHSNRFGFERDGDRRIGYYADGRPGGWKIAPLVERPDLFVAHIPMNGKSDYAWRRGSLRSCIVPSFLKREGLRFWLVLTERFGTPQPFAILPQGVDNDGAQSSSLAQTVLNSLLGLSRHWAAVFPKGVEINQIPGSGNINADAHKALIDWAEMTESIAMLGQNLSTKVEGGSFAAAESHRYVAGDIHLADAFELGETITQQIIEPIVRFNFPGAPVPVCEISTGQRQVFTIEHVLAGVCSPDEMRRTLGHEALPDGAGADLREPVPIPQSPGPNAAPDTTPQINAPLLEAAE